MINQNDKQMFKRTMKASLPSIGITATIITATLLFDIPFMILAGCIIGWVIGSQSYKIGKKQQTLWDGASHLFGISLFLTIIWALNKYLGKAGIVGFILTGVLLGLILLWMRREAYMFWIRHIEKRFFGGTMEERRKRK